MGKKKQEAFTLSPQKGSQEMFLASEADIVLYGGAAGSGKTYVALMDSLRFIHDPRYNAVYFRKTNVQLDGGLWKDAKDMYAAFGAKFKEKDKIAIFPSGARIKFSYMDLEKHKINHQGLQYSAVYFDEFTHFSSGQFQYLRSRMRSDSENKSYMKCTMNPDKNSFVFEWVKPYLLDADILNDDGTENLETTKGCPNRKLDGKLRYFVLKGDALISGWTKEEVIAQHPSVKESDLMTYTFISGTIDDNKILDKIEPAYRTQLDNLPRVERMQLRFGNWLAVPLGSNYFQQSWCQVAPKRPMKAVRVRAWDLACTVPSETNKDPDWTAGVLMAKDEEGVYYIEDVIRFRGRPEEVNRVILETARRDGSEVTVCIPRDAGAAGVAYSRQQVKMLAEKGFRSKVMQTNKSKLTRFAPFSSISETGLVQYIQADWNHFYFQELEAFNGEGKQKDDQVDATSDAFLALTQLKYVPAFTLPSLKQNNPFKRR